MPELPEVETIVRGLRPRILRKKIASVKVVDRRIIVGLSAAKYVKSLTGQKFVGISRRAKYIKIRLASGKTLLVHLGMTGGLVFRRKEDPAVKYVKWFLTFADGSFLYYIDARLFGEIRVVDDKYLAELDTELGPEPLNGDWKFADFWKNLSRRKGNLKALLLNQKFVAGIGNIYANEALFLSKISPLRRADHVKKEEARRIYKNVIKVLAAGVKNRGTSVDDYVDSDGAEGSNQNYLKVYYREGEKCHRCPGKIKRIVVGQRGTYYCPSCQK